MDYRQAGVDVEAGREFVSQIRQQVESTFRPGVLGGLGGFAGLFALPSGYKAPVLVSGTDGVGTKLKIAQAMNQHHTIGIDLVAMCVNDILTTGAEPLYFLDYLATGKLDPSQLSQVITGIVEGCRQSGCALLGGETAEMPGFYGAGEYDVAGFAVGIVERDQLLDGSAVQMGDVAIALESAGVHSNGFSLVRKIIESRGWQWTDCLPEWEGRSLGEIFLTPTRLYVNPIQTLLKAGIPIHGMAHITGGGLPENLPRCLGLGQSIQINANRWPRPPLFDWLARVGDIPPEAMVETFNLGVGFGVLVPPEAVEVTLEQLSAQGVNAYAIGEVVAGSGTLLWES